MRKFFVGFMISLTVILLIPSETAYAADTRVIADGVFIGEVDVSGMSVSEAEAAVDAHVRAMAEQEITLSAGEDKTLSILGSDTGVFWKNREVAKEAYGLGHQGNIVKRYKALKDLKKNKHVYDLELGFDKEALTAIAEKCGESFDQETVNFGLKKTGEGFEISEGQTGYLVDREASVNAIENYMSDNWQAESNVIDLVVTADVPKGSYDELSKVKDVLGSFSTSYKTSGAARSANVANGCSLINGTTVYPGEEFSVLDTITPFTESNGYFPAGSYLNGLVVESVGGGICQVSTTLYNAVLLSELEVTERHNHSMIVTYVSPSADAAIAESGGKNFKFVNSTENPIYIEGYTTPEKQITFTIYGVETRPSGRRVSYESEVLETTPASADQFVTDPSQAVGYVGTQSAHLGYKARLWKVVTEDGTVTDKEIVNNSTYKMVPKIVTVGVAGADETAMNQLGTAISTGDVGTIKAVAGAIAAARGSAGTEGADAANQAVNDAVNAAHDQLRQQAEAAAQQQEEADTSEVIVTN